MVVCVGHLLHGPGELSVLRCWRLHARMMWPVNASIIWELSRRVVRGLGIPALLGRCFFSFAASELSRAPQRQDPEFNEPFVTMQ